MIIEQLIQLFIIVLRVDLMQFALLRLLIKRAIIY